VGGALHPGGRTSGLLSDPLGSTICVAGRNATVLTIPSKAMGNSRNRKRRVDEENTNNEWRRDRSLDISTPFLFRRLENGRVLIILINERYPRKKTTLDARAHARDTVYTNANASGE
jgi:hypothetical protein